MTRTACPTVDELTALQAGRLADDRATAVAAHVDTCADCQTALAASRPLDPLLAALGRRPPAPRLDDFRVVREIGRGGMGVVYEADQVALGRRVALKVMTGRPAAGPDAARRFDREARAVARLHHTNIVPVFAVGDDAGTPFYAMQLIAGAGLDRAARDGTPPTPPAAAGRADWRRLADVGRQVADALAHAHARGVVHRDVKPANLLLDAAGTVWLTDFGLAKLAGADDLTHTGDVFGTPRYMPPEAFDRPADARGDVYALGLVLYELAAGRPAFDAADRTHLVKQILTAGPPPLRAVRADVPADLATVIHKAADRDPDRRYPTAAALADDLRRVAADEPVLARRAGPAERLARWGRQNPGLAAALAAVALLLVGVAAGAVAVADRENRLRRDQEELAGKESAARAAAEAAREDARHELYHAEMSAAPRGADAPDGPTRLAALARKWTPGPGLADPRGWEWRLVRDLADPVAHRVPVWHNAGYAAWAADDRELLVAGGLWATAVGPGEFEPPPGWQSPDRVISAARRSPDGRRLAVGTADGWVHVVDPVTGRETFAAAAGRQNARVAWHPDGEHLAAGVADGHIRVFHLPTGRAAADLDGVAGESTSYAFRGDGRRFAAAIRPAEPGGGYAVRVWDTGTWRPVRTIPATPMGLTALAWLPDGRHLVTGSAVGELRLWDADAGTPVRGTDADGDAITGLAVAPDGRRVAAPDTAARLRVWNPFEPHDPVRLRGAAGRVLTGPAWSADGRRLAVPDHTEAVPVWDVAAVPTDRTLSLAGRRANTPYLTVAWHPNGTRVACSCTNDGTAVWDAVTGDRLATVKGVEFAWSRAARRAAWVYGETVHEGDAAAPGVAARRVELRGQPKQLAWHPAADRLAVRTANRVWLWQPGGEPVRVFGDPGPAAGVDFVAGGGLAWNPAGDRLAFAADVADRKWDVHVLDPAAGRVVRVIPGTPAVVRAIAWSPDGRALAVGGDDAAVRLFDPQSGELVRTLTGHAVAVRAAAFSPDGSRLATAGGDGTVKLWNPATGRPVATYEVSGAVRDVAWTADGCGLAAAGEGGVVRLWRAGGGMRLPP